MENLNNRNQPAEPVEKTQADQHEAEKAATEKTYEINADNDNGFVSAATEESSNKGQGPAGEDL